MECLHCQREIDENGSSYSLEWGGYICAQCSDLEMTVWRVLVGKTTLIVASKGEAMEILERLPEAEKATTIIEPVYMSVIDFYKIEDLFEEE